MEITPNWTTNGIGITDEILMTSLDCGSGVAISTHEHLDKEWANAIFKLVLSSS